LLHSGRSFRAKEAVNAGAWKFFCMTPNRQFTSSSLMAGVQEKESDGNTANIELNLHEEQLATSATMNTLILI
jgi:hypothetical protein